LMFKPPTPQKGARENLNPTKGSENLTEVEQPAQKIESVIQIQPKDNSHRDQPAQTTKAQTKSQPRDEVIGIDF
jgi:hypothetical protein